MADGLADVCQWGVVLTKPSASDLLEVLSTSAFLPAAGGACSSFSSQEQQVWTCTQHLRRKRAPANAKIKNKPKCGIGKTAERLGCVRRQQRPLESDRRSPNLASP
jgi:hypothetical protein